MTSSFDHNPHASAPYSQHHFERQPPFGAVRNTSEYNKIYRSSTAQLTAIANATVAGQKWIHPILSNVLINPNSPNLSVSDVCGPTYIRTDVGLQTYTFPPANLLVPALLEKYKCYKITPGYSYPVVFVLLTNIDINLNQFQSLSNGQQTITLPGRITPYILQILITSTTPGSEEYKVIVPDYNLP